MTDTNDMHRDFEAWHEGIYAGRQKEIAFAAWQAATERATALERSRSAALCDVECELNKGKVSNVSYSDFAAITYLARAAGAKDCAAAIRQGGAT